MTKDTGKERLTTDEVAKFENKRKAMLKKWEEATYESGPDHLWLKWGTLKSWDFHSEKGKELLKKYFELGTTFGAISQHDTPEQKRLICELIDECDGSIGNDWAGTYLTKQEAKDYVMGYGDNR